MATTAHDRTAEMIESLDRLATRLRMAYPVTAVVRPERRPFPLLVVAGRDVTGRVLAGAWRYWWCGAAPVEIGPIGAVEDVAHAVAARLGAVCR